LRGVRLRCSQHDGVIAASRNRNVAWLLPTGGQPMTVTTIDPRRALRLLTTKWSPPALFGAARQALVAERWRWPLWLPVGVGSGVGVYFALPVEPWRWAAPVLFSVALAFAAATRSRTATCLIACGVATFAAGMSVAQWHAIAAAAPVLERTLRNVVVEGVVEVIAPGDRGSRLTVRSDRIGRLDPAQTPHAVRITTYRLPEQLQPGDSVRLRATLSPPPGPALPGAFDYQRRAWFDRIGGVGFATGRIERLASSGDSVGLAMAVDRLRVVVQQRIARALDGPAAGLALAMITGERRAVPEAETQAMRDSGLAHLLAISGLHLGLVAGFVFLVVRGGLALAPPIALRWPIKKWAAGVAIVVAFGCLLLAGAPVPSQRAFVMTGLVLLAVMIDRVGISMRLVGWAALVVLLVQPDAVPGASFQMSFAAVVALVAAYEIVGHRLRPLAGEAGPLRRVLFCLAGVALTSLVAGLATAPFALFHFDRLALYGLAANMLAVPIAALWVMPCAVAALVLMPLGLETLALVPMGWGLDLVLAVAQTVASWPGAVQLVPSLPLGGLLLIVAGGLWLTIWQRRWRLLGAPVLMAGVASAGLTMPPDIMVTADGRLTGFRDAGTLYVSSVQTQPFARDVWRHRAGLWEWRSFEDGEGPARCDPVGCVARLRGYSVAFVTDPGALAEDRRSADIIVAAVPVREACAHPRLVIDRFDLWRDGAHAIWLGVDAPGGIRLESANGDRGERPWVPTRPEVSR
jgi:competence protein ComEC